MNFAYAKALEIHRTLALTDWLWTFLLGLENYCKVDTSGMDGGWQRIQVPAAVPSANDHLKLVSADLLEQGSFDEAVEGCVGVFHTASLFFTKNVTDPQVSHS
jgi:hypothetical protein